MKTTKLISSNFLSKLFFLAFLAFFSNTLSAQMADYYVNVKTADIRTSGTDNHINIKIHGATTDTGYFRVKGNSERDDLEGFSVYKKDVGKIYAITIDVIGDLADKWNVEYITVTKNEKNTENRNSADGFYEFSINKEMSYDPTYFRPTYKKGPRLIVTAKGELKVDKKYITKTNFGHNPHHSVSQEVMQYSETWQDVEKVSFSESTQTNIGAALKVTYESPPLSIGKFGAEASASWNKMNQNASTKANEKMNKRTYNWNYIAPANTVVFKKVTFEIPYGYQVYSDGKNARIVRTLHSEIIPSGSDQFLFIPKMENGKVVPISWNEIDKNWLQHTETNVKRDIERNFKNQWLQKGWVYTGNKIPTITKPTTTKPTITKPTTKPTTTKPTTTKATNCSTTKTDFPVNEYVRIENYWKKGQRINVETNLTSSEIHDGAWSAMWVFKPIPGTNYYRIENRWKTTERLNIENGKLESGPIHDGAHSAIWEIKRAPATNKSFWIVNHWKPEQRIHVENGKLECSKIHNGANSAFWYLKPVGW